MLPLLFAVSSIPNGQWIGYSGALPYPGIELLLLEIQERQRPSGLSMRLLELFEQRLGLLLTETPADDRVRRTRVHFGMCLRRSIYRSRAAEIGVGALVAEADFLTGYFAPDKPSHRVLKTGVELLSQCVPDEDSRKYVYVIQMLDHLDHALDLLKDRDPSAARWRILPHYDRLREVISELHKAYPHSGPLGDVTELQRLSAEVWNILYVESNADSFYAAL